MMQREWTLQRSLQRRFPCRTKHEFALAKIDRMRDPGLRFGGNLIDAGYSRSAVFRPALTERGLIWAVDIPYRQLV